MEDLLDKAKWFIMYLDFPGFSQLVEQEKSLIQSKDKDGNTLLHLVARWANTSPDDPEYNYIQFITYLLNKGANINARNKKKKTPLDLSAEFGCSLETICLFIHEGKVGKMSVEKLSALLYSVSDFKSCST